MLYDDLTTEEKNLVSEHTKQLRAFAGDTTSCLQKGQVLEDLFASATNAIIATLDAGALIPNTSNLAGAQSLTKEELQAMVTDVSAALTDFNTQTKRELRAKASGSRAL